MVGRLQEAADHLAEAYESLTEQQRQLLTTLSFLIKFILLAAPFYLFMRSGWELPALRSLNAAISSTLLNFVGLSTTSAGSTITADTLIVDVSWDSTGWKSMLAFTALVLATNRDLRTKVSGILFGATILFAANILRITSMIYAVDVFGVPYELLHTILWRWGLTVMVLGTWLLWLQRPSLAFNKRFTLH